ncbi:MAG: glycosyltransferase family 1 protein [Synechococcaceae cyanobacterium ELA739]
MQLVFDTTVLAQANRSQRARAGIHRYVSQLLPALNSSCALTPLAYCRDPLLRQFGPVSGPSPGRSLLRRGSQLLRGAKPLWQALQTSSWAERGTRRHLRSELRLAGIEPAEAIYHSPYAAIPPEVREAGFAGIVITVHDLLPLLQPGLFEADSVSQFEATIANLHPSDQVICVSQSTRSDLLRLVTPPEHHVHVVPLAASADLAPVDDPQILAAMRRQLDLAETDRMILSLGTLEPRKNLSLLLEAFELLLQRHPEQPWKLVLVGCQGWKIDAWLQRLAGSGAAAAIRAPGFIDDRDLAALYSCADVFVYPSLYEGFGLPPLEAMHCGTPVIVSRSSSLPEVVGDGAWLVEPDNAAQLVDQLEALLLDSNQRLLLAQKGLARAKTFSWSRTAMATAEVYRLALNGAQSR